MPGLRDGRKKPEETGNSESGVSQNDARAGIALWQAAAISVVRSHKAAWSRLGTDPSDKPDDLADALLVGIRAAIEEAKGLFPAVGSVMDPLYQLAGQWIGLTSGDRKIIASIAADADDDDDAGADLPPADPPEVDTLQVMAIMDGPHAATFARVVDAFTAPASKSRYGRYLIEATEELFSNQHRIGRGPMLSPENPHKDAIERVFGILTGPHAAMFRQWLEMFEPYAEKSVATISGILAMALEMIRQELSEPKPTMADVGARGLAMIDRVSAEHPEIPLAEIVLRHCAEMSEKLTGAVVDAAQRRHGGKLPLLDVSFFRELILFFAQSSGFSREVLGRMAGEYNDSLFEGWAIGVYRTIVGNAETKHLDRAEFLAQLNRSLIVPLSVAAEVFRRADSDVFTDLRAVLVRWADADACQRKEAIAALPWRDDDGPDNDEDETTAADDDGPEFDAGHGWTDSDNTDDYSTEEE